MTSHCRRWDRGLYVAPESERACLRKQQQSGRARRDGGRRRGGGRGLLGASELHLAEPRSGRGRRAGPETRPGPPVPRQRQSPGRGVRRAGRPARPEKPSFDVVSVEPTGEAVIAGRAAPNAKVELKDAGRTVAEATANPEGQFVIIPPTLPPGEHSLALSTGAGPSAQTSNAITVAVAAPEPAAKAAAAPSTPAPPAAAPAAPPRRASPFLPRPGRQVRSRSSPSRRASGGRLVAKGAAAPNAVVRLYLSGAYVGDAKTRADGRWSLTIEHGMTPGAYEMRADEINPADAKVAARAEAPFDYPAAGCGRAGRADAAGRAGRRRLRRRRGRRLDPDAACRRRQHALGHRARNSMATARATRSFSPPTRTRSATRTGFIRARCSSSRRRSRSRNERRQR